MIKLTDTIKQLVGDKPVNVGRQHEIDLARAVPVFFLPFVHTFIECTPIDRLYDPIPFFFNIVIGQPFGAPMFLFAMGACILYSHSHSAQRLMLRGITLFIAGFLLNAVRFGIPYLIGYGLTGDREKFITPLPYRVFGNDVLQFAGLFFLLFGFLQYRKISDKAIVILALTMSVAGSFIRHKDLGNPVLNIMLGHFMGTEDKAQLVMTDFPLLNWFIIPVMGYVFGKILMRVKDKPGFYRIVAPVPLLTAVVFFVLECVFEFGQMDSGPTLLYSENCYYHLLWYDALMLVAFATGILGVYYALNKVSPMFLKKFFTSLSRNITHVYVIHWIFVVMTTNVVLYSVRGTQDLPTGLTLLLSATIFLVTYPLALMWEHLAAGRKETK